MPVEVDAQWGIPELGGVAYLIEAIGHELLHGLLTAIGSDCIMQIDVFRHLPSTSRAE